MSGDGHPIKHVRNAKHVTGIAASVWGQIYKVEPAIVIELVQEQINNKLRLNMP